MKKFLSLVLALVMTMSLVTVSAGAKDFSDNSKIAYKEAVDVMSAVKVIDGYTDGSFNPSATLTRGAAAKIICNLILGPTTASALVADAAPYKDVPVNHTFAGYIAYCQKTGIISGYADGTFKPANTLTGYAFMKMLLGALGYKADQEGYTGANWSIQVAKRAINIGLNDDLNGSFNGVKAVTREEACLYAFNTLKATMVEYDKNSTVTVGNITIKDTSAAKEMANTAKTETIKDDNKMQFAEKYFDKLSISTKASDKMDDFGRPATTWIYDKDTVGTYADKADETLVLNKDKDADVVLITDSDYFNYNDKDVASDVAVYVNGDEVVTKKADLAYELKAGDQIEVFENDDGDAQTVAVIRYSLAKIDEIETKLSNTYTKKGATTSISLQKLDETSGIGITYYDVYDGDSSKELPGFSADSYKEGTVLAIALKADGKTILASNVADAVSGKVTAYDGGSKANVTLAGSKYSLHSTIDMAGANTSMKSLNFNYDDSTYTVYTDVNGYVIGIDETEAVKLDDVYYVTGLTTGTNMYKGTYYAQAVSLKDGSVSDIPLKTSDPDTNKAFDKSSTPSATYITNLTFSTDNFEEVKGLYTFDKDGSKYTAKAYVGKDTSSPASYETKDNTYYVVDLDALDGNLARDDSKLSINGTKVYLNDKTTYIKVEKTGDDLKVKTAVGGTSVQKTSTVEALAITTKSGNTNKVATYVILVDDTNAFINAGSSDVVFVKGSSDKNVSYKDADGKTQTGYSVELFFLDGSGKTEEVTVKSSFANKPGFYTWEINDDGVYELSLTSASEYELDTVITASPKKYKDQTGYTGYGLDSDDKLDVSDAVELASIYDNSLTVASSSTVKINDVDFASNVIVLDKRDKEDRDLDWYTSEITTVSQLKSALEKNGGNAGVKAVLYLDDEKVVMVCVLEVGDATIGGGSSVSGQAATLAIGQASTTPVAAIDITDFAGKTNGAVVIATGATGIKVTATEPTVTGYTATTTLKINGSTYAAGTDYQVSQADLNRGYIQVVATTAFTGTPALESIVETYKIAVSGSLLTT